MALPTAPRGTRCSVGTSETQSALNGGEQLRRALISARFEVIDLVAHKGRFAMAFVRSLAWPAHYETLVFRFVAHGTSNRRAANRVI